MLSVAITSGGGFQGGALLRALVGQPGIRTVLLDSYADNVNRYWADSFHAVPFIKDEERFLAVLEDIVSTENVRVIFPASDYELDTLARNSSRFAAIGAFVAVSPPQLLQVLRNKRTLYSTLKDCGFPVLPTVDLSNDDPSFPLFGKPLAGWGSKELRVLRTPDSLAALDRTELMRDYVWQPYLEGFAEYSADFAIDFQGRISQIVLRTRVRVASGFAVISDSYESEPIRASITRFAGWLAQRDARGVLNVQVIEREGGDFYYSDVNPRVGTSSVFGLGVGLNLPLFVCRSIDPAIGQDKPAVSRPIRMVRRLEERYMTRLDDGEVAGIVFDLDDTLIDQKRWMLAKAELLWQQFSGRLPDRQTFMRSVLRFVEEGPRNLLLDAVIEALGLSADLRQPLIEGYRNAMPSSVPAYTDVEPCLSALKRAGMRLALLTDNPERGQRQKLSLFPQANMFDTVTFSRTHGKEKPDTAGFARVANELDVPPVKLMMVGDNLYRDAVGALHAGFGWAAWLKRPGGFHDLNYDLFADHYQDEARRTLQIENLNELAYAVSA
jgi:FMN phosphatase YigB (HAD superfamily)